MKEKEIYDKLVAERNNEMNTFSKEIKYNNLTYYFKDESNPISFNDYKLPLGLIGSIKDGSIDLKEAH